MYTLDTRENYCGFASVHTLLVIVGYTCNSLISRVYSESIAATCCMDYATRSRATPEVARVVRINYIHVLSTSRLLGIYFCRCLLECMLASSWRTHRTSCLKLRTTYRATLLRWIWRSCLRKLTSKITRNNGQLAVQGHWRPPILVPIESPYA